MNDQVKKVNGDNKKNTFKAHISLDIDNENLNLLKLYIMTAHY